MENLFIFNSDNYGFLFDCFNQFVIAIMEYQYKNY